MSKKKHTPFPLSEIKYSDKNIPKNPFANKITVNTNGEINRLGIKISDKMIKK